MRKNDIRFLPLLSLLLIGFTSWCQASVALHLKPDTESHVLGEWDSSDPRLQEAKPALEGENWFWVNWEDTFEGWVPNHRVNKDMTLSPGTVLTLEPDGESPFLALVKADQEPELIRSSGAWTQFRIPAVMTVYFQKEGPALPEPFMSQEGPEPEVVTATPSEEKEETVTEDALPPTEEKESEVTDAGMRMTGEPTTSTPSRVTTLRVLEGKIVWERKGGFFRGNRPSEWVLKDNKGKTIAYLDLQKLPPGHAQIRQFEDKWVQVTGKLLPWNERTLMIEASQIRTLNH